MMQEHASRLESVNEGRQRRPQSSIDKVERMICDLEARLADRASDMHEPESGGHASPAADSAPVSERARIYDMNVAAVEMIAEELKRLRGDAKAEKAPDSYRSAPQSEHAEFRKAQAGVGNELRTEIDRLARNVEALARRADSEGTAVLRKEVRQIRRAVEMLVRDEAVLSQGISDFGHVHHDRIAAQVSVNSARKLASLAARLEQINQAINSLPESRFVPLLEERLRALALAVEHFARSRTDAVPGSLETIESKLDEILRTIATFASRAESAGLERVEARLTSLARQFDELEAPEQTVDLSQSLSDLADRVDRLTLAAELPVSAVARLGDQIQALTGKIDRELIGKKRLEELEARLDAISNTLAKPPHAHDAIIRAMDSRFSEMSRQLGGLATAGLDPDLLSSLERQIQDLNRQLLQPSGAPTDSRACESEQQAGMGREQIMQVAREAAMATIRSLPALEAGTSTIAAMAQELRQLEELARRSDERNFRTFVTLHETLRKVADRLAILDLDESEMGQADRSAGLEPGASAAKETGRTGLRGGMSEPAERDFLHESEPDLVGAARRAARLAARQSETASSGEPGGGDRRRGGVLARFRRPLLAAASISLLALAGYQLGRNHFSGDVASEVASLLPSLDSRPADGSGDNAAFLLPDPASSHRAGSTMTAFAKASKANEWDASTAPAVKLPASAPLGDIPAEVSLQEPVIGSIPREVGPLPLREAAAAGDGMALYEIGSRYAEGRGVNLNLQEGVRWFELAASAGFAPARYRLADIYEKGLAGERDMAKAVELYRLAAQQGSASAMHNLAVLFATGAEGMTDNEAAAKWFLQAAKLGVTDSQYNLGILAAKGIGTSLDLVESYKWFALASAGGDEDARARRDEIAALLSPDRLVQAEQLVEQWEPLRAIPEANSVEIPGSWKGEPEDVDMARSLSSLQMLLSQNGYDAGPADGVLGDRTRKAIADYQQEKGMQADGEVDKALVEALLAGN